MDLKQELQKIGIFLNDAVIDYINQYCDNEIVRAKEKQREKDISSAVCAFVELKRTDSEIYQLLNKHFCVENISEAQDYKKRSYSYTNYKSKNLLHRTWNDISRISPICKRSYA